MVIRKLFKSGDSLVIAIPEEYRNALRLKRGDYVELSGVGPGSFMVRKIEQRKTITYNSQNIEKTGSGV